MVISVTSSGRVQESSIEVPSRTRRYSGSERPAWRMNQTGVYGTGSLRQARMNGEFVWGWVTTGSSHSRAGATQPAWRHAAVDTPKTRSYMPRSGRVPPWPENGEGDETAAWELSRMWW